MGEINNWAREQLFLRKEEKYGVFSQKLTPTAENFIGVRIPKIRELAKEIAGKDWRGFLESPYGDYQEEKILHGMVIGLAKMAMDERRCYVERFVPQIDTWLVCDTVCGAWKFIKRDEIWMWEKVLEYLNGTEEYEIRFALVVMLNYFVKEGYVDEILRLSNGVKSEAYYVKMANAWLISVCFVKFRDKTLLFLQDNDLDKFTQNKGIQKIRESYRVCEADKELVVKWKK